MEFWIIHHVRLESRMRNKALTAGLTLDLYYVHMWRNSFSFSLSQTEPKDVDGAFLVISYSKFDYFPLPQRVQVK